MDFQAITCAVHLFFKMTKSVVKHKGRRNNNCQDKKPHKNRDHDAVSRCTYDGEIVGERKKSQKNNEHHDTEHEDNDDIEIVRKVTDEGNKTSNTESGMYILRYLACIKDVCLYIICISIANSNTKQLRITFQQEICLKSWQYFTTTCQSMLKILICFITIYCPILTLHFLNLHHNI